ncbi:MAG TPA: thiamine pyrophosphate-dependent enzyme [bacterium]|nr:thiamine pyrophosphate-dependent enzyme [bacterium]
MPVTIADYQNDVPNQWCPGCGNFPILDAVKMALVELQLAPQDVLLVSGIGQAPKLPHYLRVNAFNGLHGREAAAATAAKLVAPHMTVLVHAGDGGGYGEGGNHLLHAIRRNIDLTMIVHDNKVYGLTKGQASPTTPVGTITKINPEGVTARPLNPPALAISQSCSFVAQGSAAHKEHLSMLLAEAIRHRGFSLVNVLQPCVSWERVYTYAYLKEHAYELGGGYDPRDRWAALRLVLEPDGRLPLGVIYREERPVYELRGSTHEDVPAYVRPVQPRSIETLYERLR